MLTESISVVSKALELCKHSIARREAVEHLRLTTNHNEHQSVSIDNSTPFNAESGIHRHLNPLNLAEARCVCQIPEHVQRCSDNFQVRLVSY